MQKQTEKNDAKTKNEVINEVSDNVKDANIATLEKKTSIVKRDGRIVPFNKERIRIAIELAARDARNLPKPQVLEGTLTESIDEMTDLVTTQALTLGQKGVSLSVEGIQDLVEITMMKNGLHDVARRYIIYRDQHKQLREDSVENIRIQRHDDQQVRFNPMKVSSSLERVFRRHKNYDTDFNTPEEVIETVNELTKTVIAKVLEASKEKQLFVSDLQDMIEKLLMEEGYFNVAKEYILHRVGKLDELKKKEHPPVDTHDKTFEMVTKEGKTKNITRSKLLKRAKHACRGLEETKAEELLDDTLKSFYKGIKETEVDSAMIMTARSKIEKEPSYTKVAARLLLDVIYRETMGISFTDPSLKKQHRAYFTKFLKKGISVERVSDKLLDFDLEKIADALNLERDDKFAYLGLQTLYDRYFLHHDQVRMETPQIFWMRVAMGLSIEEDNKTERAIQFYNTLSQFHYSSATPTLFNSGTPHSQLSSCYLLTVMDDLHHIFKTVADDAQLSKWAGGIGNDWTNVRATGARIHGTNGQSQGIIPFLKVANDTAVAVNQGGKRKGAMCAYLESWHIDVEDFLELRKNTGDERRRTHDMNTANWIPDLFMKRVAEEGEWTLFNPSDVPDLHGIYGQAFEKRYTEYEKMADTGEIKLFKKIQAVDLWRKMLSMLFETGHPWVTFKDAANVRSPQDHVGVVNSSNLCTEIFLNTSETETAVCNLGSINLVEHVSKDGINEEKLATTVRTAIRMLDNVININFYPTPEAKNSNSLHRPIGLGIMGFQDALFVQDISYASFEAVEFADKMSELIAYYATLASTELAKERGTYSSYKGSKWIVESCRLTHSIYLKKSAAFPLTSIER